MNPRQAEGFLKAAAPARVLSFEPMARHTTLRVGGPARFFAIPESEREAVRLFCAAKAEGLPLLALGRGSNMLVSDAGFDGVVLLMGEKLGAVTVSGHTVHTGAGAFLAVAAGAAAGAGLTGLEFAGGIPGSVGGGVFMNAGAYGGQLSDSILSVRCADSGGNIVEIASKDMRFGYRTSRAMQEGLLVLSCAFGLKEGEREDIYAAMRDFASQRRQKQPLQYPSAGSFFKRPEGGGFAGALIEKAGLKGFTVGGAQVSQKHAGFLINLGGATAQDFLTLKDEIIRRVYDMSGVTLQPEVRIIHST